MSGLSEAIAASLESWSWFSEVSGWLKLLIVVLVAVVGDLFFRYLILGTVAKVVRRTKVTWDDIIFDHKVMNYAAHMVAPLLLYILLPVVIDGVVLDLLKRICKIAAIVYFLMFINSFLSAVYHIYSESEQFKGRPLKGLLQSIQVIVIFVGAIVIVGVIVGKSPMVLLTGLGASAAILMLVFKDSIMGFVSGIQLSANNMLKVGDWIVMPKYGADGTVLEVTLNTVKVRNWDNTIVTIPPYALVSDSFQNYRGMRESGGRRVKRSVNIDMNSVRFCSPEMLEKYKRIGLLKPYIEETERRVARFNEENHIDDSVLVNGLRQTNLGVFRAYLTAYLNSIPEVNTELTCMVRQLQPTETGIPLELYFFSSVKDWVPYEGIQADVFDHVLAVVPEFGLRIFQNPTGADFRKLTEG